MAWALVNSWTYSTPVANVDFIGLASYSDIRVLIRNVTLSGSITRTLRVSTDNGTTFLSTSGDYISVGGDGVEGAAPEIGFHTTSSALARSGVIEICGFNLTAPKVSQRLSRVDARTGLIPTTSPLSAVRVLGVGFNLTGGNIYVFGR